MTLRRAPALLALAGAALAAACSDKPDTAIEELPFASSDSAVRYEASVENAPNEDVQEIAEESLRLFRRQEDGANSLALLRRRAQQDVEIAGRILRAYGWYEADAEVEVIPPSDEAQAAYEQALEEWRAAQGEAGTGTARDQAERPARPKPEPPVAQAILRMIPGPRYTLLAHRFVVVDQGAGAAPLLPDAALLGAPVGGPAEAATILDAESAAVSRLRGEGRPWATRRERSAVADPVEKTIEVETVIAAGPAAVYGDVTLQGAPSVSDAFLRSYQEFERGAPAAPEGLRDYQYDLAQTDLFDSVSVRLPESPPEDAELTADGAIVAPVTVEMEENEPRSASAGIRYNTDAGPEVRAGFIHRNLFNAGERLELDATAGLDSQVLEAQLSRPQYLRDGQVLAFTGKIFNEDDDAFASTGVEFGLGVSRELTEEWTVGAGGLIEYSETGQLGRRRTVLLGGIPLFANYDGSDDPLDPTEGMRAQTGITPFVSSIEGSPAPFLLLDGEVTAYTPLDDDKDFVLAGRSRLASILSAELSDVPANRRLYAGGGGSVRGYAEDVIGPLNANDDPTGGRSSLELGVELRTPLYGPLRGAVFVEAGTVSEESFPTFREGMQVAAGAGVRFASPAGPIRLDVAVPVGGREVDDLFQIYISIGQAW